MKARQIDWRGKDEVGIRKDKTGEGQGMWLGLDRALRSNWSEDLDFISKALSRDSEASLGWKGQENSSRISSRYHNFKGGHFSRPESQYLFG